MRKVAVIDLGTNTFHLLIVEIAGGQFIEIFRERIFVNLAENGIGKIGQEPYKRALDTITKYKSIVDEYEVKDVAVFGTAALRTASNGKTFREEVLNKTGLQIQIIDGDREASLILKGTQLAIDISADNHLIMDIGGGSVEFILTKDGNSVYQKSFPVGVSVLFRNFHNSDPISEIEHEKIQEFLSGELQDLIDFAKNISIKSLIGASGSFEVLQSMLNILSDDEIPTIEISQFSDLYQELIRSTLNEREKMKGLPPQRIKLIVVAVILMEFVVSKLSIEHIKVSPYALKEGAITEMI